MDSLGVASSLFNLGILTITIFDWKRLYKSLGPSVGRAICLAHKWSCRICFCRRSHFHNGITPERFDLYKLIFCMVSSHDYLLWIRIREPTSPTHTGPTSKISIFGNKFHDGLTWPIFVLFGSNLVQRSFVSLYRDSNFLKWLQPFFDQPARPTKTKIENFQLLCFSSDLEEIWYGGSKWPKNSIEWVLSNYGHFLTFQPDQPKLTKSKNFQLLCFSLNLDEIWYGG